MTFQSILATLAFSLILMTTYIHGESALVEAHAQTSTTSDDAMLHLAGPFVHSVTDTTVNIEWQVSQPTTIELAWGESPAAMQTASRATHRNGSFSLTGLEPGQLYYLRLSFDREVALSEVDDAHFQSRDARSVSIGFRTLASAPEPQTYYVTPAGDDTNTGLSPAQTWRTVSHAADHARPGDAVLIGGGTYTEMVRVRTTGEAGRPVTFKAMPGEKVIFDGMGRTLDCAFLATDKSHLRFDGLYFKDFKHGSTIMPWADDDRSSTSNGVFTFYHSDDVQITRCFHDGRGQGYSPGLIHARHCADVVIENNVMIQGMGSVAIWWDSPRVRVRHNVFFRNFIRHSYLAIWPLGRHRMQSEEDLCRVEHNIFTDNLPTKVHVAITPTGQDQRQNNCFFLRPERDSGAPGIDPDVPLGGDILANPEFAAAEGMEKVNDEGEPIYIVDRLISKQDLDFPDLFATNPEVVQRDIGLQPEAFEDFHFNQQAVDQ